MPTTSARLFTFADAIEHVIDVFDTDRGRRPQRNARRAVLNAYRDFPNWHEWSYYARRGQIVTSAPYTTGTVAYDDATNTVTLTGGTWPSWAEYGEILLTSDSDTGIARYKVDRVVTTTTLTLSPYTQPGADLASQTFTLYRSLYPLPEPFIRCGPVVEIASSHWLTHVSPSEMLDRLSGNYQPQRPNMYTFRTSGLDEFGGRPQIEFGPPPAESRTYDFSYQAQTRPLFITGSAVTATTVGRALTVSSGLKAQMEGSVIRFAETDDQPTSRIGEGDSSNANLFFPYLDQAVIQTYTSSTTGIMSEAFASDYTAQSAYISDLIDIESGPMLTAFLRCVECEYVMSQYSTKEDQVRQRIAQRQQALVNAIGWDSKNMDISQEDRRPYFTRLRDFAIIE